MAGAGRVVRAGVEAVARRLRRSGAGLIWLIAILVAPAMAAGQRSTTTPPQSPLTCGRCHGELELLRQQAPSLERARAMLVPDSIVRHSAHGDLDCGECHSGFGTYPHATARAGTRGCASCHAQADSAWSGGAHATATADEAVGCAACHTVHDVATAATLLSVEGAPALNRRCLGCHETVALPPTDPHAGEVACATCHAPHDVRPAESPASRLAPARQVETCGACHQEAAANHARDAHGAAVRRLVEGEEPGGVAPPTCTTCHGGHGMTAASEPLFANEASHRCAECHEAYGEEFLDSYHGQAVALGGTAAATCSDCHTSHAVFAAVDPRSSVSDENRVATCAACHPAASASFVQFQPHANPHDREGNPTLYWTYLFMTLLLFGVLSVFGLHTLLWVVRLTIDRVRGRPAHGHSEGGAA